MNRVNLNNFNATILKVSEKLDYRFPHVFIFGNMFPESHGLVAIYAGYKLYQRHMFQFIPV